MAVSDPTQSGQFGNFDPNQVDALAEESEKAERKARKFAGKDYRVRWDVIRRQNFGREIVRLIDSYNEQTQPRRDNLREWRNDHEMLPTARSTRWDGAADIPAPLTHIYVQAHHTRLNQQIVRAIPPLTVVARTPEAVQATQAIEEAVTAHLEEAEWEEAADLVHAELSLAGNVFVRVTYDVETVRTPKQQVEYDHERFDSLIAAGQPPFESLMSSMKTDRYGNPKVDLAWENRVKYEGARLKVIPWEDGIILPVTIRDPEEARAIGERVMIRGGDLERGARLGRYLPDEVEQLLRWPGDEEPQERWERYDQQGIKPDAAATQNDDPDSANRRYLCYEMCVKVDANDDGEEEWLVVAVHYKSRRVLRLQYLMYEHGEPYYQLLRYFTRPRELFGMGVAEKLTVYQDGATAVLCQLVDHADLALNVSGNYWYDHSAGIDPDEYVFQLGQPQKVESVDGIRPMVPMPIPAEHYKLYELFKDISDLITAAANPSLGKATDTEKTLGEVQIVQGASNMIFEEVASRVARSWARVWDQVRWLIGQYGSGGVVRYRRSAMPGKFLQPDGSGDPFDEDGPDRTPAAMVQGQLVPAPGGVAFGSVPASFLKADVDLVPSGLKQLSDMQSRVSQATLIQQLLMTHPLTRDNVPVLLIALDEYLQALSWGPREKVIGEIQQRLDAEAALQRAEMAAQAAGGMMPGGGPLPNAGQTASPQNTANDVAPQNPAMGGSPPLPPAATPGPAPAQVMPPVAGAGAPPTVGGRRPAGTGSR